MEIVSTRFGIIPADNDQIITLEKGLLGFDDEVLYILLPPAKDQILGWLQSAKTPSLAFVVANPFDFFAEYEFDITAEDVVDIDVVDPREVHVLSIITVPQDPQNISANLLAPVIINKISRKGKQVILKNNKYLTKHFILSNLQTLSNKAASRTEVPNC